MSRDDPHAIAAGEVRSLADMHRWLVNVRKDHGLGDELREICQMLAHELNPVLEGTIIPADISEKLWCLFRRLVCAAAIAHRSEDKSGRHGELPDEFSNPDGITSRTLGGVERLVSGFE